MHDIVGTIYYILGTGCKLLDWIERIQVASVHDFFGDLAHFWSKAWVEVFGVLQELLMIIVLF